MSTPVMSLEQVSANIRNPRATAKAILATHRIKATLGYNIAYFLILVALVGNYGTLIGEQGVYIVILFTAVFLMKTQASLADVIHDYDIDRENPEKSILADSVDHLGRETTWTLLAIELTLSIFLWGVLSYLTDELIFVALGTIGAILGFTYSYPPRFKERGVLNHFVTSGVDVMVVLFPTGYLLADNVAVSVTPIILIVFLYSFAYHILHQAADTYYDREAGISTFTQDVGVENSIMIATTLYLIAAAAAIHYFLLLGAMALLLASLWGSYVLYRIGGDNVDEQLQTDFLAQNFNIALWATFLNTTLAVSVYLSWVMTFPF